MTSTRRGGRLVAHRSRESGVALIQVLLITGIIGLLMLQLALTAREQMGRAVLVADRVEADLRARSRETAVLYTLLTIPWVQDSKSANPYVAAWNFNGIPVAVDQAMITLQDEAGLLPVAITNSSRFTVLLQVLGTERARAARIAEELLTRQGTRTALAPLGSATTAADRSTMRRYPLQTLDELRQLPDMDESLYRRLEPLLTLYPSRHFNPLTAPPPVLATRLPPSQVAAVLELRRQMRLDMASFYAIAGDDPDEFTVLTSGPGVAVDIALDFGTAHARRHLVAGVEPYADEPLTTWERIGRAAQP
jgi:general secretion pathway protein K